MSEVNSIKAEVENRWLDSTGFMRIYPNDESDQEFDNENPSLFTAEYLYLLWKLNALAPEFDSSRVDGLVAPLRLEPGLYDRRVGSRDRHFSRDEQIGLVTFDSIFGYSLGYCRELYEYGRNFLPPYCYQNLTWSGPGEHNRPVYDIDGNLIPKEELIIEGLRRPRFRELLRSSLGKEYSYQGVTEMSAALSVTASTDVSITSGKILAVLQQHVFSGHHWLVDFAYKEFVASVKNDYGENFIYGLFRSYFKHPEHPIPRLAKLL